MPTTTKKSPAATAAPSPQLQSEDGASAPVGSGSGTVGTVEIAPQGVSYHLPAVRGIQGGNLIYSLMLPIKLLPFLFPNLEAQNDLPQEFRTQRILNKGRLPKMVRYLVENRQSYVYPAVTLAVIDGEVNFQPLAESGEQRNTGILEITGNTTLMLSDGQHRVASLMKATQEKAGKELLDEQLPATLIYAYERERQRQVFSDINGNTAKPPKNISTFFDTRDPLTGAAKELAQSMTEFKGFIEFEKSTIPQLSGRLWTLTALRASLKNLLEGMGCSVEGSSLSIAKRFYTELAKLTPGWTEVTSQHSLAASEVRREYIFAHGVWLEAVGLAGGSLIATYPTDWPERLAGLTGLDWSRTNSRWEGICQRQGQMQKSHQNIVLLSHKLKEALGLPDTTEEADTYRRWLEGLGRGRL